MACIHASVYLFWLQIEDLRPLLSCRNSSKFSDSTDHQNTTLRKNFFCCKTNFTYWTTGLRVGRALCRHCFFGNVAHTNVGDDTNEIFILHQTSIFSVSHLCKNLSSYQWTLDLTQARKTRRHNLTKFTCAKKSPCSRVMGILWLSSADTNSSFETCYTQLHFHLNWG